jgi:uncharacterized protein YjbI with pentapeptide repeats
MAEAQEDFSGNDKHYKVLRKALSENNISHWNDFAASMGPRFRADLRGMRLEGANLAGIKLTGAKLDGACLDGADLSGADLTGASLVGVTFRDARLDGTKLKSPAKVTVRSKSVTNPETQDPETRRRLKIERMQDQAREFLVDRAKKEAALEKQKAQVKARNNPSPFSNEDR